MTITQSYSDVLHLAFTLPISEQEMLVYALADNLKQANKAQNVRQKLIEYVEGGVEEIRKGKYFSNDEVLDYANRLIDQRESLAV